MKKLLSVALILTMVFTFATAVNFTEDVPRTNESENVTIFSQDPTKLPDSIEVISNEEFDKTLPAEVANMLNQDNAVMPFGPSKPTSEWNLTNKGTYYFTASSNSDDVYSNYFFTGHRGWVKVHLVSEENPYFSGEYTFKLYKRGVFDTTIEKYTLNRDSTEDITMTSFNSDDKIFFSVGGRDGVKLVENSYIGTKAH